MKTFCRCAVIALLVPFIVSCAPGYMIVREPISSPGEGKALVNFLRPSASYRSQTVSIWDSDKLIGISFGGRCFQYECDPGKHLFIAWSQWRSPVEADLLPGRTYYIVLRSAFTIGFRPRLHQIPVNKGHPLWEHVLTWQKILPNYEFDRSALARIEAENKPKILEYLRLYESEVKGSKYVQYLRAEDGIIVE